MSTPTSVVRFSKHPDSDSNKVISPTPRIFPFFTTDGTIEIKPYAFFPLLPRTEVKTDQLTEFFKRSVLSEINADSFESHMEYTENMLTLMRVLFPLTVGNSGMFKFKIENYFPVYKDSTVLVRTLKFFNQKLAKLYPEEWMQYDQALDKWSFMSSWNVKNAKADLGTFYTVECSHLAVVDKYKDDHDSENLAVYRMFGNEPVLRVFLCTWMATVFANYGQYVRTKAMKTFEGEQKTAMTKIAVTLINEISRMELYWTTDAKFVNDRSETIVAAVNTYKETIDALTR